VAGAGIDRSRNAVPEARLWCVSAQEAPVTTAIREAAQYLTFKLSDEVYALDISNVREVLDFTTVTKVPRMPEFMRGVINLRGSVVPVVDLRLKLGMTLTEKTVSTCVIITEVQVESGTTVIGALTDSVQEVLSLEPDSIAPAPRIGTTLQTPFIKGMGRQDERFIIILDIDRVFSTEELDLVQQDPAVAAGMQ
jgi:purine-binding chemotaxis protein CheW